MKSQLRIASFVFAFALALAASQSALADLRELSATPIPTPTPILNVDVPPQSVAAPDAVASCANDEFLAYRSVPIPWEREVTVCGTIVAVPAEGTRGGPRSSFALDIDGTPAVPIIGSVPTKPGDAAVIRGRYHRDKSGAEWIDRITQAVSRQWALPGYAIINGTTYQ